MGYSFPGITINLYQRLMPAFCATTKRGGDRPSRPSRQVVRDVRWARLRRRPAGDAAPFSNQIVEVGRLCVSSTAHAASEEPESTSNSIVGNMIVGNTN